MRVQLQIGRRALNRDHRSALTACRSTSPLAVEAKHRLHEDPRQRLTFDGPTTSSWQSSRGWFDDEGSQFRQAVDAGELSEEADAGLFHRGRLFADGVPLSEGENPIVWDTVRGGVWQTAGEPSAVPAQQIATTFAEFLEHYLAAGAFAHTRDNTLLDGYAARIDPFLTIRRPGPENLWLAHLARFYRS
jgi:hypothetical protein